MKKYYRISIFKNNRIGEILAALAAKSNGGQYMTLPELAAVAKAEQITYPALSGEMTPEIIGDNLLHLDVSNGVEYQTVLSIEEVEVFELEGGAAMAD